MVSDLAGNQNYVKTGHICAGNPDIHPQLLKIIAPHLTAELKA
jgi:myo-inositol-1(or 4)-monophosphatase